MEIPYKAIIDNCILKSELITKKKESKIVKYFRRRTVKKIIDILDNMKYDEVKIYKRDIVDFYNFFQDLQNALGENLKELKGGQSDSVNYTLTISGAITRIIGDTIRYEVTVETLDTVSQQNAYFGVTYAEENHDIRKYETTYLSSYERPGRVLYQGMLEMIIKYIEYCN